MTQPTESPDPDPARPFEIGLVVAGAISAGAYTAGVIDFLIGALDEWEKAKRHVQDHPDDPGSEECPRHDVKIKVMSGASAGGMTAALAAGMLGMEFESVDAQPAPDRPARPANNTLYRSWVNAIDIAPLLGSRDLEKPGSIALQSVLDSSILDEIADEAFHFEEPAARVNRPYLADELHILLTVTNLRGVPYSLPFQNYARSQPYEMTSHADNMHFIVSQDRPPAAKDAIWLKPYDFDNKETWGLLQSSALATGAFPVGLAPRLLKRPRSQYSAREWIFPGPRELNGVHSCEYWEKIPPLWDAPPIAAGRDQDPGKADEDLAYEFLCVDGGVMNNEPLDLARQIMAGPDGSSEPGGDQATRAIIMVLPFPNSAPVSESYDGKTNLVGLLATTFSSLVNQARFKPRELAMANNPNVYSRFLVVPRRGFRGNGLLEPFAIASGSLGGFGGFLSRKFREHDFQLGRRNCQWFLKQYFVLPSGEDGASKNKLFDRWSDQARDRHRVIHAGSKRLSALDPPDAARDLCCLPIVPLVGKAAEEVPSPTWPSLTAGEFQAIRSKVKYRLDKVVRALIRENIKGHWYDIVVRWVVSSLWWLKRNSAVDSVMATIKDDLTLRGLMDPLDS